MRKTSFIFAGIMSAIIGNAYATGENVVASKSYVDTKQVKLHAANDNPANNGTTVVTYTDTEGTTGERGIFDWATGWDEQNEEIVEGHEGDLVTADDVIYDIYDLGELERNIRGTAGTVVVRDDEGAPFGSRSIYGDTVANYNSSTQSNDIPTMGAVMSAITASLPTGTAGNVVTYDANGVAGGSVAVYDGSNTYNAQDNANDLITAGAVRGLPSITMSKLVCANTPDCTLWTIQDHYVLEGPYCKVDSDCPICPGTPHCNNGTCECNTK